LLRAVVTTNNFYELLVSVFGFCRW